MIDLFLYLVLIIPILALFYYHYFVERPRTYYPFLIGTILLFIFSILLMGNGISYPCLEYEHKVCRQTGYEYWWEHYYEQYQYDSNCCDCVQWDTNTTTLFCQYRGTPFPTDNNPDFNRQTNLWQNPYGNIPNDNTLLVPKPNEAITLVSWVLFALSLIGMAYMLYFFFNVLQKRNKK